MQLWQLDGNLDCVCAPVVFLAASSQKQYLRSPMSHSSDKSRRDFLKDTSRLVLAAGALGTSAVSLAATKEETWCVSCRDTHLKSTGQPDCWSALKQLGAAGVEVQVDEEMRCTGLHHPQKKYTLATADGARELREDLDRNSLRLTALCMSNRLDERLERELEWTKAVIGAAKRLEVQTVRIDVVPRAIKTEEYMPFAVKACKQMCDLAKDTPVRYGIENHGHWTNQPKVLEELFSSVGSPQLGLTLDAMNFYWFGHPLRDLYGIFEKFAGKTFHTHCKNLQYPEDKRNASRPRGWEYEKYAAPLYEGDVDYARVVQILRKANYRGDLCLENECLGRFPKEDHPQILKKEITFLKSLTSA